MPEQPTPIDSTSSGLPNGAGALHAARPATTPKAELTSFAEPEQPADAQTSGSTVQLVLSGAVVSRSDVSKCLRELSQIDEYFHQARIRGSKDQPLPTISRILSSLAEINGLNFIHAEDRSHLKNFLASVKASAPVVHMSFPSEASGEFLGRLLEWFRGNAHPHTVLHIGLQPELAAGFTLRTTNKLYDFSFRRRFEQSKQKLVAALEAMDKAQETTVIADANATNQPTALSPGGGA